MRTTRTSLVLNMLGLGLVLVGYGLPWFVCPGDRTQINAYQLIVIGKTLPLVALILSFLGPMVLSLMILGIIRSEKYTFILVSLLGLTTTIVILLCPDMAYPPFLCIFVLGIGFFVAKIGALLQFISGIISFFAK